MLSGRKNIAHAAGIRIPARAKDRCRIVSIAPGAMSIVTFPTVQVRNTKTARGEKTTTQKLEIFSTTVTIVCHPVSGVPGIVPATCNASVAGRQNENTKSPQADIAVKTMAIRACGKRLSDIGGGMFTPLGPGVLEPWTASYLEMPTRRQRSHIVTAPNTMPLNSKYHRATPPLAGASSRVAPELGGEHRRPLCNVCCKCRHSRLPLRRVNQQRRT